MCAGSNHNALYIHPDQLRLDAFPEKLIDSVSTLIFSESIHEMAALPFHQQKITFVWSAQRHFARQCKEAGFDVTYLEGEKSTDEQLRVWLVEDKERSLVYMEPAEWGIRKRLGIIEDDFINRVTKVENSFFMSNPEEWKDKMANGYVMEFFYREMRKRSGYLMNGNEPEGGQWNYDKENRKKLPAKETPPGLIRFEPDEITCRVIKKVKAEFPNHFGNTDGFSYAVSRSQALKAVDDFFANRFSKFGPYEDAMAAGRPHVYHSVLSVYLNNGLLSPDELCERAVEAYQSGKAPLNSAEGFIRQIIGWREYIRNYYETMMPGVRQANEFGFRKSVPQSFWDGDTNLRCVQECLKPVLESGYSHHIPRLMVLSNFANLTETDPGELFRWFWYAYADAWEWVVLPNVLGMSTFADGGVLATKPYVSSGNYINKMSDYCSDCSYDVKQKTGAKACPFNYLYWNFVDRRRDAFEENGRVSFMVNMFDKKTPAEKETIQKESEAYISSLSRYKK